MSRHMRPPLLRAGRDAPLKKVLAACNADADRMRRERAERDQTSTAAPVVVPLPKRLNDGPAR